MKFPDRVKQNVTGSAAALVLGAAVAPYRTLAAAIAAGDVAAGDRVSVCVEDAAGNWEESYYSVTSGTQLARESVYRSSGTVTFPATAFCTVFGKDLVVTRDVAFSATVPLTHAGAAYMPQTTVTGPLTFTPAANAVRGALAYLRLVADGTNAPNFSAFKEWGGSLGYDNRNGIVNQVQFFHDGYDSWYSVSQAADAAPVAPADTTAPTLSSPTAASTGQTTGSGSVTTNEGNGTLYYRATANATETVATVKGGSSLAITSTGSKAVTVSGLAASTVYYLHFVQADAAGNDSAVTTSPSFTTAAAGDTTAPILSSPTGTKTGSTTASGTVSTNEANGTLYRLASTNAVESAATIKAANLTQAVSATGVQNVSFTGLTAATQYYAHYVHRDAAGNDSTVASSAAFTTDAAAPPDTSPRFTQLAGITESGSSPNYVYTGNSSGAAFSTQNSLSNVGLQSGVDGSMQITLGTRSGDGFIMGITTSGTPVAFGSLPYAVYCNGNGSLYKGITNGAVQGNNGTNIAPANGDKVRLRRTGTDLVGEVSKDGGATWTTFYSWTGVPTGAYKFDLILTGVTSINSLVAVGLA
ncbi:hypothetical protein [Massilia sp. BHUDP2]|uniref:hypothetical protein n=1 Tax=Massilia sp. BHUDP2 TaxID=3034505 RepID=UPI003906401C